MPKEHLSKCCKEECNCPICFFCKSHWLEVLQYLFLQKSLSSPLLRHSKEPKTIYYVKRQALTYTNDALQKQTYSLKCFPTCLFNIRRVYLRIPNRTLNFYNGIKYDTLEPLRMYIPCGWKITIHFKTTQREVLFTKMYSMVSYVTDNLSSCTQKFCRCFLYFWKSLNHKLPSK